MENYNLIGQRLSKYVIQAELGRGGMAVVYRGYDPDLDRHVAIKVLAPHLAWQKDFVDRFLREARSAARLRHPNIVTIHDVGQQGGLYYFVMECLEGIGLGDFITRQGSLAPADVITILRPLADALDYAHQQGLVHRDVKPANVIVDPRGGVKLTDFGIARSAEGARLTSTGTIMGTPEYMSPEQAQGLSVDARTDQYSLAVIAYEMLTGQVPFQADSVMALLYKVTHEPLPPIGEKCPHLPKGVGTVLEQALAKDPNARFVTVAAFVDQLEQALAGKTIKRTQPKIIPVARPSGTVVLERSKAQSTPARRWIVGVVLGLLVLVGAFWFAWPSIAPALRPPATLTPTLTLTLTPTPTRTPTETPNVTLTAAVSTVMAAAMTVSAPTATPTRTPVPTATSKPTMTPTPSATPAASRATAIPRATAALKPSSTPAGGPRPTSVATATPAPTTAAATKPVAASLVNFEQFGSWRRGDQPYGEFVQTQEQVHSGGYAGKLTYNFPAVADDYVVFIQSRAIGGEPNAVGVWVYGDNSRNFMNLWIRDAQNQVWAIPMGRVGSGWRQMVGSLVVGQDWPFASISGPDNGAIDYPVSFYALVFDRADASTPASGQIYVDDISAWRGDAPAPQPTAANPPANAQATAAPTAPPAPPVSTGEIGRIVFTVRASNGLYLYSTDPGWSQMREIGLTDDAHSTCAGTTASTLTGVSVDLYGLRKCNITGSTDVCSSPDGAYKAITNHIQGDEHSLTISSGAGDRFYYQGKLNWTVGIQWTPNSQQVLFGVDRSVNIIRAGVDGYQTIIGFIEDAWPPQIAPDGSLIYYLQPVGSEGASDVFVVNLDGSGARNLTNAPVAYKMCPRWKR